MGRRGKQATCQRHVLRLHCFSNQHLDNNGVETQKKKHLLICSFADSLHYIVIGHYYFGSADEGEQQHKVGRNDDAPEKPSLWKMTRNAFPPYTSYLEKAKALLNQGQAYIFPPNLEGSGNNIYDGEETGSRGGGGAGEKVREVVGNSFGKSTETVDSSAKTAAKLVGETVKKTKEKVKRSFSDRESTEPRSEL
ncbi:uncharacterized protein Pyn_15304 [Prunus yedoensis var. nudiflora]|uniref:Uncharacterized protein n=1 Tax=Prunus yedoensis var. nudiflora TaxID=2094558 RepID=A0A314Y4G6_PRUYE|nr:uncharacterized protein Pyn_15304 [Prunus yedoensis var. nudiflora]